mgnify:CR=1 FL=1
MKWGKIPEAPIENVKKLSDILGVTDIVSKLLIQRGINNFDSAKDYFRPEWNHLYNPFLMKDMQIAVDRIKQAIDKNEKVIKEDFLRAQLADILKAYVGIVDKRNYEVPLGTKEEYLFLDKAISFIEQKVKGSKALISFPNLVKEIHALSGIEAKRCAASIFCGLLEYTKLGKIQMKQENAFSSLELAKVSNGTTV